MIAIIIIVFVFGRLLFVMVIAILLLYAVVFVVISVVNIMTIVRVVFVIVVILTIIVFSMCKTIPTFRVWGTQRLKVEFRSLRPRSWVRHKPQHLA